ncbi:MAG: hypothetical protein KDA68_01740 [Planctomycetaceae bacterium]|nr:hypothetical protein [Planctomycetaceae bacterium]
MLRAFSLLSVWILSVAIAPSFLIGAEREEADPAYYHEGELAGSLRSEGPLAVYDADPGHLWNRLFSSFWIRKSHLPSKRGKEPIDRIEGGDTLDFLAWAGTTYWDEPETVSRVENLLDEFLTTEGEKLIADPLKRVMLQRDLWSPFDFLMNQNIARRGDSETRRKRTELCEKLARVMKRVALTREELAQLPNNYELALKSGRFDATHEYDPGRDYLPVNLLTDADEWQELDFHRIKLSGDTETRFVFLHTLEYRGRSYFRVFYRFPEGRKQLEEYLKQVDESGVNWKDSAQIGFIKLDEKKTPQIPVGTEVALLQFLMALDQDLQPVPTSIVEAVRVTVYKNVDGTRDTTTNTNQGFNVGKYTLKRRLAFDGMRFGGLHREPDDFPAYRIIFESRSTVDWGPRGRFFSLSAECRACHSDRGQVGVHSIPSLVNSASVDTGAQLGVVHTLPQGSPSPHPARTVKWKQADESYRRLVEFFEE